jgi:hypothetical protein
MVKAETKDKKPVPGLKVSAHYIEPNGRKERDHGVRFEKQDDGRFRSNQLQPDVEFDMVAEADGFKPASRKLSLAEGKTEEITLVLEPK